MSEKPAETLWAPRVIERFAEQDYVVFTVTSDREFDRAAPECIGWTALLQGEPWIIVAVDRTMPMGPIRIGETIGLAVRPKAEESNP